MSSTEAPSIVPSAGPSASEMAAQVERILGSPSFLAADSARRLLSFLAEHAIEHPGAKVKETELAVSLYHRSTSSFDPQVDSVARVQVGRLRQKLFEYYARFGAQDPIVIEVPRGQYCLVGRYQETADITQKRSLPETDQVETPEAPVRPTKGAAGSIPALWRLVTWLAIGALLGCLLTLAIEKSRQRTPQPRLNQFWSRFLTRGQRTIVVFSNPRLVGTLATEGLHYPTAADALNPGAENLTYAGAGDVRSIHALTKLFDMFGQDIEVASGALLSWNEARDASQIFLGRPEQNPALQELPRLDQFYFHFQKGIVDAHPAPGAPTIYNCSSRPYSYDHAMIAFIPGIHPPYSTLILGGNTTYGSQAAVEFMSQESTLSELLSRLKVSPGQPVPYFEALLKVHISRDIPIRADLLAVRPHSAVGQSWEPAAQDDR